MEEENKNLKLRNVAIIAHVDHGKTTLVDKLLSQNIDPLQTNSNTHSMDSNQLEKERGITIISKCASLNYKDYRINLIDTPGHSDFGGEVERILNMVDGALLLVDAYEGAMPQTKFVTSKALNMGLKLILVVNKIDRPAANPKKTIEQIFDLFADLGASDEQLDFDVVYTSAKLGYALGDPNAEPSNNLDILLETLVESIPAPEIDDGTEFKMLVSDIQNDKYLGRLLVGRILQGSLYAASSLNLLYGDHKKTQKKCNKIFRYMGVERKEEQKIMAGDIALVAGFEEGHIGDTLCDISINKGLDPVVIDLPTISMFFRINDSPLAGKEGKFCTSRQIRDRLNQELLSNVALKVEDTANTDTFKVSGRGELHLSILIETMRRQGYEFAVSRPEIIFKKVDNNFYEPFEELNLELPSTYTSSIIEELGKRRAEIKEILPISDNTSRLIAHISTMQLFGLRSIYLTLTKGEGILYHSFLDYRLSSNISNRRQNGVLIATESGRASAYAIWKLEDRGVFFIKPNVEVYKGMIVGMHNRANDLNINVCMTKKLTNVRASSKDDNILLTPVEDLFLEKAIEFINDDELVEITPQNIRLRKFYLDENLRKRYEKPNKLASM